MLRIVYTRIPYKQVRVSYTTCQVYNIPVPQVHEYHNVVRCNCLLFPASSCELLLYAKYPYSSVQSSTVCFFRLHRDTTAIYNNTRSHISCICLPGLCCIAMQPEDDIHTIRSIYDMHINMYNNNNVCIKYVCAYFHIYTHFEASSSRKVE